MAFPFLPSKKWLLEAINKETTRALDKYFKEHAKFREADETMNTRLNLLVLQGLRLEDRGQELEKLSKELKDLHAYAHTNVHDMKNLVTALQLTIDQLQLALQDCPKIVMAAAMPLPSGADEP